MRPRRSGPTTRNRKLVVPENRVTQQSEADELTKCAAVQRQTASDVDDETGVVMDILIAQTSCRRPLVERALRSWLRVSLITGCDAQPQACIECFWSLYRVMILVSIAAAFAMGMLCVNAIVGMMDARWLRTARRTTATHRRIHVIMKFPRARLSRVRTLVPAVVVHLG